MQKEANLYEIDQIEAKFHKGHVDAEREPDDACSRRARSSMSDQKD